MSTLQAMGDNRKGNVIQSELQKKLNSNAGENKTEVIDNKDSLIVKFIESKRYYEIDSDGNISDPIIIITDDFAGDLTKGGECDGTESNPYKISCIEDLVSFSQNVNNKNTYKDKYIILTRTLDFNSIFSYNDYTTTQYGDLNTDGKIDNLKTELTKTDSDCIGFTPIGNLEDNSWFSGVFDGQGNEINNIYQNSKTYAGLFGCGTGGFRIMNLGTSGNINSQNGPAGGILACTTTFSSGTNIIINCYNKCNVSATFNGSYMGVGGIVGGGGNYGAISLNIINCYNAGNITLKLVTDTTCTGAGGIIGEFRGDAVLNVYNCYNLGKVTSANKAGGILGTIWAEGTSKIVNCYNVGEISGTSKYNIAHANSIINCFYKETVYVGLDSKYTISFSDIKEDDIAQKLNDYITENSFGEIWKYWEYDEDNDLIFKEKN